MEMIADAELVQRAKSGDVTAFETLYRRYNDRLFNFVKQITNSADDAGDVTQEAFARAWNSLPKLRQDATFNVWLHQIALNLSRDLIRKRGNHPALSLDNYAVDEDGDSMSLQIESDDPTPEVALVSSETKSAVRRAIKSLSPDHRTVVAMHHISGMDVDTIAKTLNVPRGTVMSRLSRAREILKRKLVPYVEEGQ